MFGPGIPLRAVKDRGVASVMTGPLISHAVMEHFSLANSDRSPCSSGIPILRLHMVNGMVVVDAYEILMMGIKSALLLLVFIFPVTTVIIGSW